VIGGKLMLGTVIVGTLIGGRDPSITPLGGSVICGIEIGGVVKVGDESGGTAIYHQY
jgi:hypothetical protein